MVFSCLELYGCGADACCGNGYFVCWFWCIVGWLIFGWFTCRFRLWICFEWVVAYSDLGTMVWWDWLSLLRLFPIGEFATLCVCGVLCVVFQIFVRSGLFWICY